jgi:5-methylcytosine-specific restriction enzyme A
MAESDVPKTRGVVAPVQSTGSLSPPLPRYANWMRDELILALDLYVKFKGNPPGKASPEVHDLSELLQRLRVAVTNNSDFRNPNGVYMKMMNFRRFDPVYRAQGKSGLSRGSALEEIIWDDFASDPERLARTADAIRANIATPSETVVAPIDFDEAEEGRVLTRAHLVRERNRKLVEAKKREALEVKGRLTCEAFDFQAAYGDRGSGFIEAHHALPLHMLQPGTKTRLADLRLLWANCHRMVHSRRRWLTIDELRSCLRASGRDSRASGAA